MTSKQDFQIKRVLISVSNKVNILPLATLLQAKGIEIISTGGTSKLLSEHYIQHRQVSDITGFPELFSGRVKTLHPYIHGGILARRDQDSEQIIQHQIPLIDLVIVNLYPFAETVATPEATPEQILEQIDIGGPTLIRAAAKNYHHVTVITDPDDYPPLMQQLQNDQTLSLTQRCAFAAKAFQHTAHYEQQIQLYFSQLQPSPAAKTPLIEEATTLLQQTQYQAQAATHLRYGENHHQQSILIPYAQQQGNICQSQLHQGKPMSYNNLMDADTAWQLVNAYQQPACVIVKHANPCGVAVADNSINAYQRAYLTDPTSAFGGIIALNRELDAITAKQIIDQQFVEVLVAPTVTTAALQVLAVKPNLRVLSCGEFTVDRSLQIKSLQGGLLLQEVDINTDNENEWQVVTQRQPTAIERQDLQFAWSVAHFVKSNAIVYAKQQTTVGIGAGQMSRIDSTHIASIKAANNEQSINGAVMASDAFFPFHDSIHAAAKQQITAIIQPGGSMRDQEVIAAADQHQLTMIFTGRRHFRH